MKSHSAALLFSILLLSLFFEVPPIVDANPTWPNPVDPYIIFNSPTNHSYANGIGFVTLDISVGTITNGQCPGESYQLTYSLDGQPYSSLQLTYEGIFSDNSMPHSMYTGHTSLPSLSEGNHTIDAHCIFKIDKYTLTSDNKVLFSIDKTPPEILNMSIENKTYQTTELPLNFTTNEPCYPSYSLDGQPEVQFEGNTTLLDLTSGTHNIAFYAQDRAGNRANLVVFFAIEEPGPLPIALFIALLVIAVLVSASLIFYFKRKRTAALPVA
jgi:hypothetical protein